MKERFEVESNSNVLFVTNQCNNHCIMCCQPPKKADDYDYYFKQNVSLIKTAPKETKIVCITGGEPTLAGKNFIELVKLVRRELPNTDIQILSNGRSFIDKDLVRELKLAGGDSIFVGVPLHSDYPGDHDIIAGSKGAYNETITGLYNLAEEGIATELRIIINKMNYQRLSQMADFIFKNLFFVSWVAFMGMEDTGWATRNERNVWIEPVEYMSYLSAAVRTLADWNFPVSIFNIPLCLLPKDKHQFASKSISDWKTKYIEICDDCSVKNQCCGLFSTSKKVFKGLHKI